MKPCTILAAATLCCLPVVSAEASLFHASQTIDLANPILVEVELNDATQQATISITGPDNKWFGVGFGNDVMQDTYAILAQDGFVEERKMESFGAGVALAPSFSLLSDSTSGGLRTLELTRPLAGATPDHYTFLAAEAAIPIIAAHGRDLLFEYHEDRAPSTLSFSRAVPVPGALPLCLVTLGALAPRRATRRD
jgi:hypothetical protein